MIPTYIPRIGKFREKESKIEVTRSWTRKEWELLFKLERVSVRDDEQVLEKVSGGGYTIV